MWSVVVVLDRGGYRFVQVIEIWNRSAEDIPVLQDLVDGFNHAVRERDIDPGDELPDRRILEVGGDKAIVVFRPAIHDEIDMLRR